MITKKYLAAALHVGVDLIKWNDAGRIIEFKVMLRPLKAMNLIHQKMAVMLQAPPRSG